MADKVYALDHQQIPDPTEVIEGAIRVFCLVRVLIDPGVTHSFVKLDFMSGVDVKPAIVPYNL